VTQLTRATAAHWALRGATVNAILPGGFMTEPNQGWARESPHVIDAFKAKILMNSASPGTWGLSPYIWHPSHCAT